MKTQDSNQEAPLTSAEAEKLVTSLVPGLRLLLARRAIDEATQQDIVAETLIILVERLPQLQDPSKIAAFAAQVARNLAMHHIRRRARLEYAKAPLEKAAANVKSEPYDETLEDASAAAAIRTLLRELPHERDRLILKRFYLDEADRGQIEKELSLSPAAFNTTIQRARQRLRELIEKSDPSLNRRIFG